MKWTWEVYERIYAISKVNVGSQTVRQLLDSSPQCIRAMVNEYRADAKKPLIEATDVPDVKEVDEVLSDFFGLVTPTAGAETKPTTGEAEPPTTLP
jgi:hypothetical protein